MLITVLYDMVVIDERLAALHPHHSVAREIETTGPRAVSPPTPLAAPYSWHGSGGTALVRRRVPYACLPHVLRKVSRFQERGLRPSLTFRGLGVGLTDGCPRSRSSSPRPRSIMLSSFIAGTVSSSLRLIPSVPPLVPMYLYITFECDNRAVADRIQRRDGHVSTLPDGQRSVRRRGGVGRAGSKLAVRGVPHPVQG